MARTTALTKRSLISKANSTMVIATTAAAFVLVFSLVAGRALISQMNYQNRVVGAKKDALKRLEQDLSARDSLKQSYEAFVEENPNAIGGTPTGTAPNDGDNAQIVLDALPSRYDFPALTTSLEKLINGQGLRIVGITGTDDEVNQGANTSSPDPKPIAMPFQAQVNGSVQSVQSLVDVLLRSIRPFQIQVLEMTGDNTGNVTARIDAQTYYQPEKNLNIKSEVVK